MIRALEGIPDRVLDAVRGEVRLGINATRFWRAAVDDLGPVKGVATRIVQGLGWHITTTNSRFAQAGLPSPAECVEGVRMVYAAHLFKRHDDTVATVAYLLGYHSPQSFNRHVMGVRGMTAGEFREQFPYSRAIQTFLNLLVIPHAEAWTTFDPAPRRLAVAA